MPPEEPPAALKLGIDWNALQANWRVLDSLSGAAQATAAVKADGYGLGARNVVCHLREAGCREFFVAHWSEAADLLDIVEPSSISVLHGPLTPADAAYAREARVKPVINSVMQARLWIDAGGGPCDVMVDTGINRLGLAMSDLAEPEIQQLEIDVLMSHLASADEDVPLNEIQRLRWVEARNALSHRRSSLANSAGIVLGSEYHGDMTRPGLSLYGGIPRPELADKIRQVAFPQAAIMQVRAIQPGEGIGYNSTFIADRPMKVGTISIGYADGYLRCWSGKGIMSSKGHDLLVLGRVSMDMTVIDLSNAPDVSEGDWAELHYDLPKASELSGLSQYELLTGLGRRFPR